MRSCIASIAVLVVTCLTHSAGAQGLGTLKGQFVFNSKPPKPAMGVAGPGGIIPDESLLVDAESLGIANIIVSLYGKPGEKLPEPILEGGDAIDLDVHQARFEPRIAIVNLKQALVISNADKVGHVTTADLLANEPFAFALKPGERVPVRFLLREPLPTRLKDAIHPWLTGYLVVTESFATVSNNQGKFEIPDLPPGKWTFRVWHERSGFIEDVRRDGKLEAWKKGRVTLEIRPNDNDLGEIRISPKEFPD